MASHSLGVATLYQSCEEGNIALVKLRLKAGEDVNQRVRVEGAEWTPLMRASCEGNVELVELLLEFSAEPNLQVNSGLTALMLACKRGQSHVVGLLNEYGAQVDLTDEDGWSALMYASQNGHTDVVRLLYEYGARVDMQDSDGWTALMLASLNGYREVVHQLSDYGARVDLQENEGWTPLMCASFNGHIEVVKLLLESDEHGAHNLIDLQDIDGRTALMLASQSGQTNIVKLLHEYGAHVDLQTKEGWTALMCAAENGHTSIVKLLQRYGSAVDLRDNEGWTATMFAIQNGHSEVINLLHQCCAQLVDLDVYDDGERGAVSVLKMEDETERNEIAITLSHISDSEEDQQNAKPEMESLIIASDQKSYRLVSSSDDKDQPLDICYVEEECDAIASPAKFEKLDEAREGRVVITTSEREVVAHQTEQNTHCINDDEAHKANWTDRSNEDITVGDQNDTRDKNEVVIESVTHIKRDTNYYSSRNRPYTRLHPIYLAIAALCLGIVSAIIVQLLRGTHQKCQLGKMIHFIK